MRAYYVLVAVAAVAVSPVFAQDTNPGRAVFESRCARCHGADGNGGELGPNITGRLATRDDAGLAKLVTEGLPLRGMPPNQVTAAEMAALTNFLRSIQVRGFGREQAQRLKAQLVDGRTLEGAVASEGFEDVQLRTDDGRIHLLRRVGDRFREVTSGKNWPSYNGDLGGNRYTTMTQIAPGNVSKMGAKWMFQMPNAGRLQGTPLVVDGVMYVSQANECYALDAGTGRQIWRWARPRTRGFPGDSAGGTNRGVAVAGERVFIETDSAHLVALNRGTGAQLWDTELADWHLNYFASSAPLAVGNLVIAGTAGGENGARGFLAAFDQSTGKEVWRFWTVPKAGEPGSETWSGNSLEHGGAPTWFTGVYDAELDTVYWPTGNPSAEYNGDNRAGDNLYSDCILALDAKTGKLKWYYQTTPHDLWDWDAAETPIVADMEWQGRPRKLLLQGNRNGFFYVLDRETGKMLLGQPFVKNLTWASGIGADGRPVKVAGQEPSEAGTKVCPSQDGATNWYSPSFNPQTGMLFLQTDEKCSTYLKRDPGAWEAGKSYLGGSQRTTAGDGPPMRVLKAIDVRTGKVAWELPQPGRGESWGGTLATSNGLVFFLEEGGAFMAAEQKTGKVLWKFETGQSPHASPMVYEFDGKEMLAVMVGGTVVAFGLE